VFAVNGKINSAEIYVSNGLFRKMWPKLLAASAIEAISHRADAKDEAPPVKAVAEFIAAGDGGTATEKPLNFGVRRVTHESDKAYQFETTLADGWVHRSYLSK